MLSIQGKKIKNKFKQPKLYVIEWRQGRIAHLKVAKVYNVIVIRYI